MRMASALFFALRTIAGSPAMAGKMTVEKRTTFCDSGIIPVMQRYKGKPHDREACIRDPDAYLKKITAENQAHSRGVVRQKQKRRSTSVRLPPGAYTACREAITRRIRFVDSADFSLLGIQTWQCSGKTCIAGDVSLRNGLGSVVPHNYYCEISGGQILRVGIAPGSLQ